MYKTLIWPALEYTSAAWDSYLKEDIENINRIQKLAVSFIKGDYRRSSSIPEMLRKFNLETPQERWKIISLKFFYLVYNEAAGFDRQELLLPAPYHSPGLNHTNAVGLFRYKRNAFKYPFSFCVNWWLEQVNSHLC